MAQTLASALRNYRLSALIARRAVRQAREARSRGTAGVAAVIVAHQLANVTTSRRAVPEMLTEQGIPDRPVARLVGTAFSTDAPTVGSMLAEIDRRADLLMDRTQIASYKGTAFDRLVESIVQDAARAAEHAAVVIRPTIAHVRHVNLPCCSRCAILAGVVYRWQKPMLRHPGCFPAGAVVSGPRASRATRRWYEGELVVIRTAAGKELTATANHPILTDQGWMPANLLAEGGYVLSRTSGDRSRGLLVPDHDQVPARIEDVWRAGRMRSLSRVPVAAEDFHGDGVSGSEVDVVLTDGLVRDRGEIDFLEPLRQHALPFGVEAAIPLDSAGAGFKLFGSSAPSAGSALGGNGLSEALLGTHLAGAEDSSLPRATYGHLGLDQPSPDHSAAYARTQRDGVLTFSRKVSGHQVVISNGETSSPRWDAPADPLAVENTGTYASRGVDLARRLVSQVETDRVVKLERIAWSGHVYNLTSAEGWYDANGLIVSNCDCSLIPTTVSSPLALDPDELVRSGQVRGLSKADLQAHRDGADIGKLVNVRRTQAGLMESGQALSRGNRPTPVAIYREAGDDRGRAIELLARHGYIS